MKSILFVLVASNLLIGLQAGIIKDIYNKITNTNNKTEETVKQSAPICGSGAFSTPNESTLSPEIIFITNKPTRVTPINEHKEDNQYGREGSRRSTEVNEVAREFRFHGENVTIEELENLGFDPDAPVSILMHGFTSGYPLQAWISGIVEAYTIDRDSSPSDVDTIHSEEGYSGSGRRNSGGLRSSQQQANLRRNKKTHNIFIVNWNYASRGIIYPRAVANIPIVASYMTRFINDKLIDEAHVDPKKIELVGHSLGAHLAGYIGKNTKSKLGRIYGLDPAGPCFGSISGPLYPASKRLAPTDAEEVITIHTNSALLGISKPIGKYSVFVEGGSVQPGCKGGGILKSLQTLTWDGGDFDTIACSHSRAPNLLTYRHDQSDSEDDCQLVAYECEDWDSYMAGHCGVCTGKGNNYRSLGGPRAVECIRIGLGWQYPTSTVEVPSYNTSSRPYYDDDRNRTTSRRPNNNQYSTSSIYDGSQYGESTSHPFTQNGYQFTRDYGHSSSTRRPSYQSSRNLTRRPFSNSDQIDSNDHEISDGYTRASASTRRPNFDKDQRDKRMVKSNDTESKMLQESSQPGSDDAKILFMRTGDTQPYCAYHYQVILELNEPFQKEKPPMSLLLQDSQLDRPYRRSMFRREQNSLTSDEFGNKFDDRTYTHLLTSGRKLNRVDHATLLIRDGLPDGDRILKALHVNYMSHIDPSVRKRLSTRLCPVKKNTGQHEQDFSTDKRFYFEPCYLQAQSY